METIVFIGSHKSGSSQDCIEAAERLGYYTVLLTNRKNFIEQREEFPHVHEMILTNIDGMSDIRTTLEVLERQGKHIVTITSSIDPYVYTAAVLGRELGLPNQTASAISIMLNKTAMRDLLRNSRFSPYYTTNQRTDFGKYLPLVVKCPRSNGSKDVFLAKSIDEIDKHVRYLERRYPHEPVLFEEYIGGRQYLVEVLVHDAQPHIIAIVEQTVTRERRFIVTAYRIRPSVSQKLTEMTSRMVKTVVNKTGMTRGAIHIEFKVSQGDCKIIEVNPRISGSSMNRMIHFAFGINLVEETLKSQLGMRPDLQRKHERHVFNQFLTVKNRGILEKVTGRHRARRVPGVAEVYVKPRVGSIVKPPVSMGHRYAYVIGVGNTEHEAEHAATTAASMITFHIAPR